ncbi:MAG: hypothetical protein QM813_05980 [Verrucomicrobiota bacterium]
MDDYFAMPEMTKGDREGKLREIEALFKRVEPAQQGQLAGVETGGQPRVDARRLGLDCQGDQVLRGGRSRISSRSGTVKIPNW